MRILNKKSFRLPRLEKDKFVELVRRSGIGYQNGFFFVKDHSSENILKSLSEILKENVGFTQTCAICGKDFPCENCNYYNLCPTHDLPLNCLCQHCRLKPDSYNLYVEKSKANSSK